MKLKKTPLLLAVALSILFLAGCREKKPKLYIYNWSYYTPEGVIAKFEKDYNCTVVLDYFASNEEMYAKMKAAGTAAGFDIIVPSADYVSIMIKQGMLEKIDLSKFPNASHISPLVLSKADYDPRMEYSVPYYMGAAGIAVHTSKVEDYDRDWSIFADTRYKDRMCMMDDMREVMGDALTYLGFSVNTKDPAELEAARKLVNDQWKPNLVKFDAEGYAKGFEQQEFWITQGYAEGIFEEIDQKDWDEVDFFIPEEGGPMYIDSLCIPKGAKHYDLAMAFINYIHDPANYAEFLDRFHFPATVNPDADEYRSTVPFYTVEEVENCELKEDLGKTIYDYNTAWESIRYTE